MKRFIALIIAGVGGVIIVGWLGLPPSDGTQHRSGFEGEPEDGLDETRPWVDRGASSVATRWKLGHQVAYEVEAHHQLEIQQPDGSRRSLPTRLKAHWETTVLASEGEEVTLGHQLEVTSIESASVDARSFRKASARLQQGAFTTRHRVDGAMVSMSAEPSLELEIVRLLRSYVTDAQFVRPDDSADVWQTREWSPTGSYRGHYTSAADGILREKKARKHSVAAGDVDDSREVESKHQTRFEIASDGWPISITIDERSSRRHAGALQIESVLEVSWARVEPELRDGQFEGFEPVAGRLEEASASRLAAFREGYDAERAAGMTLESALDQEALARINEGERARALTDLTALLRHRPELIHQMTPEMISELPAPTAVFAVSALTGVRTEEAMNQVGKIVASLPATDLARRRGMGMAAALGAPATRGSIQGLQDFVESDGGETSSYGLLALGAQAREIDARDDELAGTVRDDLHRRLVEAESPERIATLLKALGNAADPGLLQLAAAYAQHSEPLVRGALVHALRFVMSSEADVFIRDALLNDPEPSVRQRALMAVSHRPRARYADALRVTLRADASETLHVLALRILTRGEMSSEDIEVLRWVAENDASQRVRRLALERLAQVSQN